MNLRDFLTMRANEALHDEVERVWIRHDADSVRAGWYEATCWVDDWHTSGNESTVEDVAHAHVVEQHRIGKLIAGLWEAVKSADEATLRLLAAPFAGYPDFKEGWRPE